ncbi:MAG TPA: hypothetical protein VJT67_14475, partial [Longimicrobiaceae bacterium]|nr:hypothetical protein [Longimicrobiaceae bacterium]
MLTIPFELLSCSWPRPVVEVDGRWVSEPEWGAPLSPFRPQPQWRMIEGEPVWTIDWCRLFGSCFKHVVGSEMKRFHVVFRIRVAETGRMVFWDDDGSIIRLGGRVVHEDRSAHSFTASAIQVQAGDVLEVAQWQKAGEWMWGARTPSVPAASAAEVYAPLVDAVSARVDRGDGPPLKFYTNARHPLRAIVSLYSLVLNGYAPSQVLVYGSHQWSPEAGALLRAAFPFAQEVQTERVLSAALSMGGPGLATAARRYWYVMKACVAMLDGPDEFAVLDDDLFVLGPVDDALEAFRTHDLVYTPDTDHAREYHRAWGAATHELTPSHAANFNAGLYWCRRAEDRRRLGQMMARVRAVGCDPWVWEQGFIATIYTRRPVFALPTQRYLFPLFDGLPGGALGYDYAGNPCGLASVHYGGIPDKPTDDTMRYVGPELLA